MNKLLKLNDINYVNEVRKATNLRIGGSYVHIKVVLR